MIDLYSTIDDVSTRIREQLVSPAVWPMRVLHELKRSTRVSMPSSRSMPRRLGLPLPLPNPKSRQAAGAGHCTVFPWP